MNDEVNLKNTKSEILEAYHEALEQLKASKKASKQEIKSTEDKKEIVAQATGHSADDIFKNIATLKLSLVRSLEDVEEKLLSNYKQLTTLQQALEIQTKELAELYEIKAQAESLAALLHAQKEQSLAFEADMKKRTTALEQEIFEKRLAWKKEQEEFELSRKEYEKQTKKNREREEEEYIYQRNLTQQKEHDQYIAEKALLEKELSNKRAALEQEFAIREATIRDQEQEFRTLKQKAEKFPEELQQAIQETTASVTERLTFKFDYETQLTQREVEGERKLLQQMITALESKVAQLESQAKLLSDKTNQATLQVQSIAVKALESASLQRFAPAYNEKNNEQIKQS